MAQHFMLSTSDGPALDITTAANQRTYVFRAKREMLLASHKSSVVL